MAKPVLTPAMLPDVSNTKTKRGMSGDTTLKTGSTLVILLLAGLLLFKKSTDSSITSHTLF